MAAAGLIIIIVAIAYLPRLTIIGDNLLRRKLSRVIPNLQELLDEPKKGLELEPSIRRRNRFFSVLLVGAVVAAYAGGITGDLLADKRPGRELTGADWTTIEIVTLAFFVPLVLATAIWLRGSVVILRPEGPLFQYRGSSVACSWNLFFSRTEPVWLGQFTLVVPINPDAVNRVEQTNKDQTTLSGSKVKLKPCRPWSYDGDPKTKSPNRDFEFLMDDLYECDLEEVVQLFRHIAQK